MPQFEYQARDGRGTLAKGFIEASDSRSAAARLRLQGLTILTLAPKKSGSFLTMKLTADKVGIKDLALFTRQFGTMLRSGISATRCLSVLDDQATNKYFKQVIQNIRKDIESGLSLSASMVRYPNVFSNLYTQMIAAGELGGNLEETLERLADFGEKDLALRGKIKNALMYPGILLVLSLGVIILLVTTVVPTFAGMLNTMNIDLPLPTRILMGFSELLLGYWWALLLVFGGAFYLFSRYLKSPRGRIEFNRFTLKLPVLGPLNQKSALSRFTRTLSTLIKAGVPLLQALEITARAVDNAVYEEEILRIRHGVQGGDRIAVQMGQSKLFPSLVVQMTTAGEESGQLEQMLNKVSDFYDQEVDYVVNNLTATLEPLMLVFMGGIIAFIMLSLFLPYFSLLGGIK
ncbi:MAG: type II secretion system F family protein [bacterium]